MPNPLLTTCTGCQRACPPASIEDGLCVGCWTTLVEVYQQQAQIARRWARQWKAAAKRRQRTILLITAARNDARHRQERHMSQTDALIAIGVTAFDIKTAALRRNHDEALFWIGYLQGLLQQQGVFPTAAERAAIIAQAFPGKEADDA